jgi:hypothetical protein
MKRSYDLRFVWEIHATRCTFGGDVICVQNCEISGCHGGEYEEG